MLAPCFHSKALGGMASLVVGRQGHKRTLAYLFYLKFSKQKNTHKGDDAEVLVGHCSTHVVGNTFIQGSILEYMATELLLSGILVVLLFSVHGVQGL
jgi:hypothetical protein